MFACLLVCLFIIIYVDAAFTLLVPYIVHVSVILWVWTRNCRWNIFYFSPLIGNSIEVRPFDSVSSRNQKLLQAIFRKDPLYELSSDDCMLLLQHATALVSLPEALPKLLEAIDWTNQSQVNMIHRLLDVWEKPIDPTGALVVCRLFFSYFQFFFSTLLRRE